MMLLFFSPAFDPKLTLLEDVKVNSKVETFLFLYLRQFLSLYLRQFLSLSFTM